MRESRERRASGKRGSGFFFFLASGCSSLGARGDRLDGMASRLSFPSIPNSAPRKALTFCIIPRSRSGKSKKSERNTLRGAMAGCKIQFFFLFFFLYLDRLIFFFRARKPSSSPPSLSFPLFALISTRGNSKMTLHNLKNCGPIAQR